VEKGVAPAVLEKDFWVCWTLKHLFSMGGHPDLLFKVARHSPRSSA